MNKKLTTDQQAFIVQSLARYMAPSEVAEAVKFEFGLEVSRQLVNSYVPGRNPDLAARWENLFESTRRDFITSTADIGIAQKVHRLKALGRMFKKARRMGNYHLAAKILEQAAKESGCYYDRRRKRAV